MEQTTKFLSDVTEDQKEKCSKLLIKLGFTEKQVKQPERGRLFYLPLGCGLRAYVTLNFQFSGMAVYRLLGYADIFNDDCTRVWKNIYSTCGCKLSEEAIKERVRLIKKIAKPLKEAFK